MYVRQLGRVVAAARTPALAPNEQAATREVSAELVAGWAQGWGCGQQLIVWAILRFHLVALLVCTRIRCTMFCYAKDLGSGGCK